MKIPSGWYLVARSSEIRAGRVIRRHFFGQDLTVWRTASGDLRVSDPVCPHLGTDLSRMGKVEGEHLVCPSHDFHFDAEGNCVGTMFCSAPARAANVLYAWPVHEVGGLCFVYYDAHRRSPTWRIPDHLFDHSESRYFVHSRYTFDVGIDIINEDNFDLGHFYKYHQIYDVRPHPVTREGHVIRVRYGFKRHSILFKARLPGILNRLTREIAGEYGSELHGPGFTFFDLDLPMFGFHFDYYVFPTPITPDRTLYTTFLRRRRVADDAQRSPVTVLAQRLFHDVLFAMSLHRLRDEHRTEGPEYWETKSRVTDPILAPEEAALIDAYRDWCRQFDPASLPVLKRSLGSARS